MTRVGIVGCGRMGANMARRLHAASGAYRLSAVYDRDSEIGDRLASELQVTSAGSPAEVTAQSDVVLTVVSDDDAMRTIFADQPRSLLDGARGRLFINCATVTPAVHREINERIAAAGARSIEACMAGSITQTLSGTLVLLCAGEKTDVDAAEPLLTLLGHVHYVGGATKAAEVKALVNMLMNINTAALAEALGLGAVLGIDLDLLRNVFAQTGANSRVLETDGADMIARDHEVYFSAAHAAKDSGIALRLAEERGLHLPLAATTKQRYDEVVRRGFGESDKSVIAELTFPGRGTPR